MTRNAARQIGPIGTLARVLGGTTAIVLPVTLAGLTTIEALIALLVLPVVAGAAGIAVDAGFRRYAPRALTCHAACSAPGWTLIALVVAANDAIVAPTTANGNVTIWVWLGTSMLIAAARGYSGCEVLAWANILTGRREGVGCLLYTPIDRLEARHRTMATTGRRHADAAR
jgi:hypothetical protein